MTKETCRSRSDIEQLETIFGTMFDAVFILDLSTGKIVYANRAMCAIYGYSPSEAFTVTMPELCPGESPESLAADIHSLSLAARGSAQLLQWKSRKKDGTLFWTETSLQKTVVSGKDLVIAVVRDISDRKRMEEELFHAREDLEKRVGERTAELRSANELLEREIAERDRLTATLQQANMVVENSPVVLFRWKGDDEWPVELVSGNIIMFGYTPDEFLSGSIVYSSILHPDDLERVTREIHDFCNEGADQFRLEYRIMTKGGEIRWVNEHTNVERDTAGGVKNFEGIVIDVTERKLAEEELKRQKKLLEELNDTLENRVEEEVTKNREKDILLIQQNRQAALGEMLDHIAHQWKQPLTSLSLVIQDLGDTASAGELTDELVKETVCITMALLDHMIQTMDVFRGFYRPDKEKKVFNIKDSIDQALAFIAPALGFQSIAVELDIDPGLTAFGYPKEYAQVLLNILANARDAFKARETENPRVIIRVYAEDGKTVVTITDNAGGIPEAIIDKIFDFYFSTNESNIGTGIGLYMSKNIIEKNMGGTLSAVNTDSGAQFRIELKVS